jgi:predicted nucleic acid-binding protein
MRLVVDTSVLIDHLRGNLSARQALADAVAGDARICSSVVVKVEVLAGMRPAEEHKTRQLLDALDWIAVDDDIAERAGLLANHCLRSHPGVDPVDYIIAATAQRHDAELWTRNLKHFPMFPDLHRPTERPAPERWVDAALPMLPRKRERPDDSDAWCRNRAFAPADLRAARSAVIIARK